MGFRSTFRPQMGPIRLNTGMRGLTSVAAQIGSFTFRLWDHKGRRRGVSSVDLPGPLSYRPNINSAPQQPPFSLNPKAAPASAKERR